MRRSLYRRRRGGFTLVELLVVVLIVVLLTASTIAVVLPALAQRQVSEAARILQASLAGARDAAIRANAPRGIRLVPDTVFNGRPASGDPLAAGRIIPIEPAGDYNEGRIIPMIESQLLGTAPNQFTVKRLVVLEAVDKVMFVGNPLTRFVTTLPNPPTGWFYNIRQGDKVRLNDSGRSYTVAGPMTKFTQTGAVPQPNPNIPATYNPVVNPDRFVNYDIPGGAAYPASVPISGNVSYEFLYLVDGEDNNNNGYVDEGFDGIDNDGDGVIDPGFNGIDDNGDGIVDDPAEMYFNGGGEYEDEVFDISPAPTTNGYNRYATTPFVPSNAPWYPPTLTNDPTVLVPPVPPQSTTGASPVPTLTYSIARRPVPTQGGAEVTLPGGVVVDMTGLDPSVPYHSERSRLPLDPFTGYVEIMVAPNGQVISSGAASNSAAPALLPFFHFWLTDRGDVQPVNNTNFTAGTHPFLPLPRDVGGAGPNVTFLKGERRLVTLFTRSGVIVTNSIETFSDGTNIYNFEFPYQNAQNGVKEEL